MKHALIARQTAVLDPCGAVFLPEAGFLVIEMHSISECLFPEVEEDRLNEAIGRHGPSAVVQLVSGPPYRIHADIAQYAVGPGNLGALEIESVTISYFEPESAVLPSIFSGYVSEITSHNDRIVIPIGR